MTALFVGTGGAAVVLLSYCYRPTLIGGPARRVRRGWRRATGVDYGRHAHASTPPRGVEMRDPAGGVDSTGRYPVVVPPTRRRRS